MVSVWLPTSLVAQTVKHLSTVWETWVHPRVGKIPWRRKWQPTPVLLPRKPHGWRSLLQATVHGVAKTRNTTVSLHFHFPNTYRLTWVFLTLDVGYHFTADSAKRSHCSFGRLVAPLSSRPWPPAWVAPFGPSCAIAAPDFEWRVAPHGCACARSVAASTLLQE